MNHDKIVRDLRAAYRANPEAFNRPYRPAHSVPCEDCWGDSDPLDDAFYCPTCGGRGWVDDEALEVDDEPTE